MIAYVPWNGPHDPHQPQGRPVIVDGARVRSVIAHLRRCMDDRAEGLQVSFITDPEWLIDVAINRRAGWPDDPSHTRGSCTPVGDKYPKRAEGDEYYLTSRLAGTINGTRAKVHPSMIPMRLRKRLAHRIADNFNF